MICEGVGHVASASNLSVSTLFTRWEALTYLYKVTFKYLNISFICWNILEKTPLIQDLKPHCGLFADAGKLKVG